MAYITITSRSKMCCITLRQRCLPFEFVFDFSKSKCSGKCKPHLEKKKPN